LFSKKKKEGESGGKLREKGRKRSARDGREEWATGDKNGDESVVDLVVCQVSAAQHG
jgi:hypothetical protein